MPNYTDHLALIKPLEGEQARISQINSNMDTLDAKAASTDIALATHEADIANMTNGKARGYTTTGDPIAVPTGGGQLYPRAGALSPSGGGAYASFNIEQESGTNKLIVPERGIYTVTVELLWTTSGNAGTYHALGYTVNADVSASRRTTYTTRPNTGTWRQGATWVTPLNEGDKLGAFCASGPNTTAGTVLVSDFFIAQIMKY